MGEQAGPRRGTTSPTAGLNSLSPRSGKSGNLVISECLAARMRFVTKLNADGTKVYATYLGGSATDAGNAIAVSANGNAYLTGSTFSNAFPTANAIQPVKGFSTDAFVTQINSTGSSLIYSTFLGGDANDIGRGITLDATGNAYVAGSTTSSDFPILNAFQPTRGAQFGNDGFISKLNATGNALLYSTYIGGAGDDQCLAITVDSANQPVVTGTTSSTNFPLSAAFQSTKGVIGADAFVTKLSTSGSSLIYSSYLGGSAIDSGRGVAVNSTSSAYIVGTTASTDFPVLNPLQATRGGSTDAFITKIVSHRPLHR